MDFNRSFNQYSEISARSDWEGQLVEIGPQNSFLLKVWADVKAAVSVGTVREFQD